MSNQNKSPQLTITQVSPGMVKFTRTYTPCPWIPWNRENLRPSVEAVRDGFCHYFAGFDVPAMLDDLNSIRNWNNGTDYISADFDADWHLVGMQIGIFVPEKGEYQIIFPTRAEFLELMEEVIRLFQEYNPKSEARLQELHTILLQNFSAHSLYL